MGLVAKNVWIRPDAAGLIASKARDMSLSKARLRAATVESLIASATALTAAKSPLEAAGNPASITLTCIRSSCRAIRNFSSLVIEAPGLCSPSRNVVSKIINCSLDMLISFGNSKWTNVITPLHVELLQINWTMGDGFIYARGAAAAKAWRATNGAK